MISSIYQVRYSGNILKLYYLSTEMKNNEKGKAQEHLQVAMTKNKNSHKFMPAEID